MVSSLVGGFMGSLKKNFHNDSLHGEIEKPRCWTHKARRSGFPAAVVMMSLFCVGQVQATTYYVDKATGSDSRAGTTLSTAWATIGKANATLRAGDIVYVRAGTYDEIIEPTYSGAAGAPITYKNYPGETVILRGEAGYRAVISIGVGMHGNWNPKSYIVIDGFTLYHVNPWAESGIVSLVWIGAASSSQWNTIRNCIFHCQGNTSGPSGGKEYGVFIQVATHTLVENNTIYGWPKIGVYTDKSPQYTTIRGNDIRDCVYHCINVGDGLDVPQYMLIENNYFGATWIGDGIQFEGTQSTTEPIYDHTRCIVVRNNIFEGNCENGIDTKSTSYVLIEGNILHEILNDDGGEDVPRVHYRYAGAGTIMHGAGNGSGHRIMRRNVLYDGAGGIMPETYDKIYHNTIIYNNRDYTGPDSSWTDTRKPTFDGIAAWNSWGTSSAGYQYPVGVTQGASIKNNIIGGHNAAEIVIGHSATTLEIDYNLYFNDGGVAKLVDYRGTYNWSLVPFSQWPALLAPLGVQGCDVHSFQTSSPLLVKAPADLYGPHTNFDFHLQANSPAINAGGFLTKTTSAGSGTSIPVQDAGYFFDGWGYLEGDLIQLQGQTVRARILSISGNTLVVDKSLTWSAGQGVSLPYQGAAPDIGAYEYAGGAATTYTLTISATNGTVTKTPDQTSYTSGQTVTLQAVPNTGYTFSSWSGDLTGTTNPATLVMDGNKSVTANFYGLGAPEVAVLGSGASITDGDTTPSTTDYTDFGSVAQGGAPVSHAFTVQNVGTASLTLGTVTVPTGFTLTEGLATSLAAGASDTFTVQLNTTTAGTKTGVISFATNDSDENPFNFTITGIVTPSGSSENLALGKPAVASTTDGSLVASNVTDGNLFTRWSSLRSDPQWIYVDLGSVYAINRIVLRWEVAYGRSYQLQVSDDATTWSDVYSTTTGDGGVDDIALSTPASGRYVRMLGTQRGTRYGYSLYEYEIMAVPVTYTLSVSATNGTVTKTPNQTSYTAGQTVTLQAVPNAGYAFSGWSGDLTGTTNPATLVMNSNKSVTANFTALAYTLAVSATNGTVTRTPDETSYTSGQTVTLQATPNAGYTFSGWSGDLTGTANPATLVMDADKSVTANFTAITYTLMISAVNGAVTRTPDQTSYTSGQTVTLQATPNTDYTFSGWSGDLTGTANPATLVMDANKSVTATFVVAQPGAYYVDRAAGNDNNDGQSPATAWKTLAKVNSYTGFVPSDQILLHRGHVWREQLLVPASGTAEKPITIGAYDTGNRPLLKGSTLVWGWTSAGTSLWTASLGTPPNQVFFDGIRGTRMASQTALTGPQQWSWAAGVLYVYAPSDPSGLYLNPGIEASVSPATRGDGLIQIQDRSYVTVQGIQVTQSSSAGIGIASSGQGITIQDCEVDNSVDGGVVATSPTVALANVTVESCLIHHNNGGLPEEGSVNLALGKPAFASSTENSSLPATNATDGNLLTRWSSLRSDPQWIYVDLGSVYAINRIVLRWEVAYGRSYQLQVSDDATAWSDVYSTTTGDGGVDDIPLSAPASGRYVRMLGTQRGTRYGYSLYEFEAYGSGKEGALGAATYQDGLTLEGVNGFAVRDCQISGNYARGVSLKRGSANGIIEHCRVYANALQNVYLDGAGQTQIRYNRIYDCGADAGITFGLETSTYDNETVEVYYNLFWNNACGISFTALPGVTSQTRNISILNNTFYNHPVALHWKSDAAGRYSGANNVKNNLLWAQATTNVEMRDETTGQQGLAQTTVAYNGFQQGAATDTIGTNAQVMIDPYFVDPSAYDFHRSTVSSPTIDTGTDVGLTQDFDGEPVPQGSASDIGAYEAGRSSAATYTLTVSATNGMVTKTPNQTSYSTGQTVTLQAVPNTGYTFSGWSGDLTGTTNPATVVMDTNKSVTANFTAIPVTYTLSVSATNGTVTKTPNQTSYTSGQTVTLQATPDPSYKFSGWSGDLTGTTNPATLTMNANKSVTASFRAAGKSSKKLSSQAVSTDMNTDASLAPNPTGSASANDQQPPVLGDCSPTPDSIQAAPDTLVILHVRDAGQGVDGASVAIRVGGYLVYTGDADSQRTAYGICYRSGTRADYTYTFQPHSSFGFSKEVTVVVEACDLAGNVMPEQTYSFATAMYSFGASRIVSKDQTGLTQGRPATVRDRQGNLWVVWQAGNPGSRQVYIGMIRPDVDGYSGTVQLSRSAGDHCHPAIAVDGTGTLYVVWQENASGMWDVCMSMSVDGQTWSAPQSLAAIMSSQAQPAVNRVNPVVAAGGSSSGLVAAAWQEDRAGDPDAQRRCGQDIYVARSTNGFQTATISRVTSDPADQTDPALAIDDQDTIFVLWTDIRDGSADIYGAASNAGPWTNMPIAAGESNQSHCTLAVGTSGRTLHMAWVEDKAGHLDVFYTASEGLPTSPVAGASVIDDTSGADQQAPALAVAPGADGTDHVFLCWEDARNVVYSGATDLYFADVSSSVLQTNVPLEDGASSSPHEAALGTDRWGYPYVVWVGKGSPTQNSALGSSDSGTGLRLHCSGVTYANPVPLVESQIVSSAGGLVGTSPKKITTLHDVSVAIPALSCPIDATIRAAQIRNPRLPAGQSPSQMAFGPSGLVFAQPVTITIPYVHVGRRDVRVCWFDAATGMFREDGIANVRRIRVTPRLAALQFETTRLGSFYLVSGTVPLTSWDSIRAVDSSTQP
jgi:uncharacterized repeat protein (TIGR02543 family)